MRLTKHHGLGNDFLVVLDPSSAEPFSSELVTSLCDRRRGIGADGVMRATRPPVDGADAPEAPDAVMELYNADGSRAELSGNGIRCLAQALLRAGWATPPDVTIATDAGLRTVSLHHRVDPSTDVLAVDMGPVRLDGDAPEWTGDQLRRAAWADVGNPHLVVEVDDASLLTAVDLVTLGEKVNASVPAGTNVHLVASGPGPSALTLRTYERGVGLTEACGTGACASAAVARGWGLVSNEVTVHMPGGTAEVQLGSTVRLVGPATVIALIDTEVDPWH
jgi:diaminopimelate epimerase